MSKVFITSDLHFKHTKLATNYRGFNTVEEHDELLINNWNKTVNKRDKVFILGDLSLGKDVSEYIRQLKGTIVIIGGNHDSIAHLSNYSKLPNVLSISGMVRYKKHWLTHAPIHPKELRGLPNITGHIHANYIRRFWLFKDKRYINACVDVNNYTPIEFNELIK